MTEPQSAPEGWYDDPEDSRLQRYWDGGAWTERRTFRPLRTGLPDPLPPRRPAQTALMVVAIVLCLLGFLAVAALLLFLYALSQWGSNK